VWVVRVAGPVAEPWRRFLFVDFEGNLPSWFSALLLLACGAVAGTVTAVARSRCGAEWHDWALVAGGLVALSADEAAALHELLVVPVRELVGGSPWLRFPLILPGTGVVLVAAAALGRFVRHLPSATRRTIVTGSAVFLLGALVIETVGGWFDPDLYGDNVTYVLLVTVEEACEMIGVAIVLVGLLRHIERHVGRIDLRVVDAAAGSDDGGRA